MLKKFLLQLARSRPFGKLIGSFFAHLSFLLPVRRLYESETLLAFSHPRPSYPAHILLVPKKAVRSLADVEASDLALFLEILQKGHSLAKKLDLTKTGYQLILNAGAYQDIPQLHVHLISGNPAAEPPQVLTPDTHVSDHHPKPG